VASLEFLDLSIVKSTDVVGDREQVWSAWTNEQELAQWFGRAAKVELRPGGAYEIYFLMDAPAGLRGGEGNTIQSYLPGRLLAFTWNAPPSFGPLRDEHTFVLLEFSDLPAGGTRVILRHYGWRPGADWAAIYAYFDRAWTHVLASLGKHFGC
jgi:uncharacterized protein YndB with AHSA1/START domain